ncbi:pyridoxal phosphate-dependent transferase [Mrakia frigida]|uniref:pyridoxal phosphate-dependent transferase n=1 Tax=Mrakia frigida TaxID=29902 RepID=UPI003FCC1F6B
MSSSLLSTLGTKPVAPVDPSTRSTFYRSKTVPRTAVSGKGIYVTLDDGSVVIDGVGGAAVCSIGNGDERVVKAVTDQMQKLAFVYSQQYSVQPAEDLADLLIKGSKGVFARVAFVCGGSEANESAIKLVRQYWWQKEETKRSVFIGRNMSYHGNTLSTLSVGHHPVRRAPYEAIIDQKTFQHVSPALYEHHALPGETPLAYSRRLADELEAKILEIGPENVAAFFAEPMVGATTGCVRATEGYWPMVREVCDKYGVLLVLDEVMCGMWRMGSLFAFTELCEGVTPDILTCAKGLGSGYVSIGAMLVSGKVIDAINQGPTSTAGHWAHGHTYVGHPVACAGALAVQKIIEEDGLAARVKPLGDRLSAALRKGLLNSSSPVSKFVSDVRGFGLFWAVEYKAPSSLSPRFATRVYEHCLELGLVTLGLPGTIDGKEGEVVMLAPAFICTEEEIDKIAAIVIQASEQAFAGL